MALPSSSTLVGQVVSGRYLVEGVLGQGGQGMVYRARDQRSGLALALKVLNEQASKDPQAAGRFLREQAALQALAGTSAVQVYDAGETEDKNLFLALELLEGHDLEHELEQHEGPANAMAFERIAELSVPVTDTLDAAHEKGILHRDLKPANIFLLRAGGVRLLDFGFARLRSSKALTAVGTIMGSPSYIAPETWRGRAELVDHRVDVYAMGVLLFRMVAGELPFRAKDMIDLLRMVTAAPRPVLSKLRPDLPRAVDRWVEQALSVEPEKRFQSAGHALDQLFVAVGAERALSAARARHEKQDEPKSSALARALLGTTSTLKRWASFVSKSPAAPKDAGQRPEPPSELPRPSAPETPDSQPPPAQRGASLSRDKPR